MVCRYRGQNKVTKTPATNYLPSYNNNTRLMCVCVRYLRYLLLHNNTRYSVIPHVCCCPPSQRYYDLLTCITGATPVPRSYHVIPTDHVPYIGEQGTPSRHHTHFVNTLTFVTRRNDISCIVLYNIHTCNVVVSCLAAVVELFTCVPG